MTTAYELENIDPNEIDDLLNQVEKSFDIQFGHTELMHISTFGELCDHIANKIQFESVDDCTSQQAFYKLRDAISTTLPIESKAVSRNFALNDLLPRQSRRSKLKKIEQHLGFKINILRPHYWIKDAFATIFLTSLILLFIQWRIGLSGLLISMAGSWLANKTGNELDLKTLGQVVEKMTFENYLKSRRNPTTFNKNEIEKLLTDWFSTRLGLEKCQLTREAKFV